MSLIDIYFMNSKSNSLRVLLLLPFSLVVLKSIMCLSISYRKLIFVEVVNHHNLLGFLLLKRYVMIQGRASSSSSQRFPPSRATFYRSLLKENNDNYAESVERGDEGGDAPNKKQPGGDHGETARVNDDMLLLLSNGERKDGKRRRAFVKKERRSTDNSIVAARVFELMADQSPSNTLMNNKEGGPGRMMGSHADYGNNTSSCDIIGSTSDVRKLGRQEENEEEEEGGQEETVRNTDIIAIRDIEFRSVLRHLLRNCYDNLGTVENEYLNRDAVQMVLRFVLKAAASSSRSFSGTTTTEIREDSLFCESNDSREGEEEEGISLSKFHHILCKAMYVNLLGGSVLPMLCRLTKLAFSEDALGTVTQYLEKCSN